MERTMNRIGVYKVGWYRVERKKMWVYNEIFIYLFILCIGEKQKEVEVEGVSTEWPGNFSPNSGIFILCGSVKYR